MAEKYFNKFPTTVYNGHLCLNITERATVLTTVYNDPTLFYGYDIKPAERPDQIAGRYYGDQYMSWILYLANRVVDPYYEWYLDQNTFDEFVAKKYGTLQNAVSKIKYFRNNWYADPNAISVQQFNSLSAATPALAKYYEPVYAMPYGTVPDSYKRKQVDWLAQTNEVIQYTVDNGSAFINDEVVKIQFNIVQTGTGQVCFNSATSITLQHIVGIGSQPIVGDCRLTGTLSGAVAIITNSVISAQPIPPEEDDYWTQVTYYDYETEINEKNKSIRVLNSKYTQQVSKQLKKLLA